MTAKEDEIRRRRERGRLSQARFRKKQAQEWRQIQDENKNLKTALADIVRAAQRGHPSGLLRAVRAAADISGIESADLRPRGDEDATRELGDACEISETVAGSTDFLPPETDQQAEQAWDGISFSMPLSSDNGAKDRVDGWQWQWEDNTTASTSQSRQSRSEPQFEYDITDEARLSILSSRPPQKTMRLPGRLPDTFAAQLYFACTDYVISLCRLVVEPYSAPSWFQTRPDPEEARTRLHSVMHHTPPMPSVHEAYALAQTYREHLYAGNVPATCSEGFRLPESNDHDPSPWVSVTGLEGHVRRRLGDEAFSRLEHAIAAYNGGHITPAVGADDRPEASSDIRLIVRLLVKNLAESYTCFGTGPQWRADSVAALFSEKSIYLDT
ncbi:hypothetical protein GGR50DRAFT_72459 [Xylaria sp. CBS 124048]|nr:hypothetical protein GGR50DRAFT_72459 [Xylaria sp. CBS 124048]